MFCEEGYVGKQSDQITRSGEAEVARHGIVEGVPVGDIVVDTGSSRTLVRRDLVPKEKMTGGEVPVRCAHGDIVSYPLAQVEVRVGGSQYLLEAAVSERLPVAVLLGRDVPGLANLLNRGSPIKDTEQVEEAMAVTTRAQRQREEKKAANCAERERLSGVQPHSIVQNVEGPWQESQEGLEQGQEKLAAESDGCPGGEWNEDIFTASRERAKLTKRQKRINKKQYRRDTEQQALAHPLDLTAEELRDMQEKDDSLAAVRKAAIGGVSTAGTGFFEREGLLYRRWTPRGRDEDMAIEQLMLPTPCRKTVLQLAHELPLAGHMGKKKTSERILQRFYWPTLFHDVAEHCRICGECQRTSPAGKSRAPLVPLPVIDEPFQRMAMDIVGPLPRSHSGNKYLLVVCDYATRYPEAVPLHTIDAPRIAEELVKVFAQVGVPREILTDQGSNFTSQMLTEIYRLLGVQPIRTSPYHPQTDGLVERFNQTLKRMLKKAAMDNVKDWDKFVPYLLFAYREFPQASTGFSPFELIYGRQVRGPLDILKESWEASTKSDESVVSYVLPVQEKLAKMSKLVQENMAGAQREPKRWYDRNARQRQFESGDQVLVLLPTSSNKLLAQWQGPYPVLRRVGGVNYQVDMYDKRKQRRIFHVNMLRKWHTPTALSLWADEAMETEADEIPLWKEAQEMQEGPSLSDHLTSHQRDELQSLLKEFRHVLQNSPGMTFLTEHSITTGSANAMRQPQYHLPHVYRDVVLQELQEMEEEGIIERSSSEWAAPIVLVPKKDGTLRFCVDYRKLNSVSETDTYPMPRIDEMIDRLGKAKYITTLDLTRGYW